MHMLNKNLVPKKKKSGLERGDISKKADGNDVKLNFFKGLVSYIGE